ncbi:MAG TPA: hypothetical protein VGE02_10550 [Gemmatimonadales bacterium]
MPTMFLVLLLVTFLVAAAVSFMVARVFSDSIGRILGRLIPEELSSAWHRYVVFALYVVGISGGVRVWSLEQYISPRGPQEQILELTAERWTLEVYRTVIGTLQGVAWMLLVFFLFSLVAYVIVRAFELRAERRAG